MAAETVVYTPENSGNSVPAYLIGDSARDFADVVCQMGCRNCRCESGKN